MFIKFIGRIDCLSNSLFRYSFHLFQPSPRNLVEERGEEGSKRETGKARAGGSVVCQPPKQIGIDESTRRFDFHLVTMLIR